MRIYLMRHGEAGFNTSHDDLRELTDKGRARIEWNITRKHNELVGVDVLFSSPILRAKQTSEMARKILGRSDPVKEVNWLIHESNPSQAIMQLSQLSISSALLFSHQPLASRLVQLLCDCDARDITMNTASIIAMEVDPVAAGLGSILWQLS